MDIQTLGSLGEFVGSIAVLITVLYLAVQIRQTGKATRQRSHSDILSRRQQLLRLITEDRDFIELWSKGSAREELDSIDAQRFTTFALSLMSHLQDVYIQYQAGLITREVWEAEQTVVATTLTQPGFRDWWAHGKQFFTPSFIEMVESIRGADLVLYDPATRSWSRPKGGLFGKDAN